MRCLSLALLLILGLISITTDAQAQRLEHWQTAGAGLSTPLGFNVGSSYSLVVKDNLFLQASGSFTSDPYVTRHSVFAAGPAIGLRQITEVALLSVSAGPMYSRGVRGADQNLPGTSYDTVSMNVIGQMLFREINMGVELYTNFNPVRNVSGMRLIYRLGNLR
ncbi:MAG TPA: hypothetical protein VKP65_07345 [Rhodothermales bacterium]|nr:hypothetical protein [Rhodothermales bacterium]